MKRNQSLFYFLVTVLLWQTASARTFTNTTGRKIEAEIVEVNGGTVVLKMSGKNYPIAINTLSKEDQEFIGQWGKNPPLDPGSAEKPTASSLGDFSNLKMGEWTPVVESGDDGKDYNIIENADGSYTYQSPHFEFHVGTRLSNSVVKEFARIFEATYQFIDQAPFGLAPKPSGSGYFQTKLYETRAQYAAAGGSTNSGGHFAYQYSFKRGGSPADFIFNKALIEIPLPSLGVSNTGTRYIIDHDKENKTLIHEIVHQVMMRWLPVIPTWMSEGFAEFVESQDYSNGKYRTKSMSRAVKDNVLRSGKDFTMVPLERLMTVSSSEWSDELASNLQAGSKNYKSANLLLGYFALLDGDGKGEGLANYLKAVSTGTKEETAAAESLLRGRSYAQLEEEVIAAWNKEGVKITFQ